MIMISVNMQFIRYKNIIIKLYFKLLQFTEEVSSGIVTL